MSKRGLWIYGEWTRVAPDPALDVLCGHRAGVVVALGDVTAELPQGLHLPGLLDAFGHHDEPEVVPEVHNGADDDAVAVVLKHVLDEGSVDLQLVNG